jgi:hypothetical protein
VFVTIATDQRQVEMWVGVSGIVVAMFMRVLVVLVAMLAVRPSTVLLLTTAVSLSGVCAGSGTVASGREQRPQAGQQDRNPNCPKRVNALRKRGAPEYQISYHEPSHDKDDVSGTEADTNHR